MKIRTRKKDGCLVVSLSKDGVKKIHSVARLVYKAFNSDFNYQDKNIMVWHKDNNPKNNNISNLMIKIKDCYTSKKDQFVRQPMISNLGKNIKKLRIERSISLNELARKSDISGSTISKIETGITDDLKTNTVIKIAKALNVSLEELVANPPIKNTYDISDVINQLKYNNITFNGRALSEDELKLMELNLEVALKSIQLYRTKQGI
ncbi:TPA: helix-turn-helix transcriptional regulator [Clostridium botulinum]|nr:helix-turn-helix transcriptional regulator [Clostridium botulinum]HBJ1652907.1 helix-turn-helix transcriptional regulator [Clostridium botulinum]